MNEKQNNKIIYYVYTVRVDPIIVLSSTYRYQLDNYRDSSYGE